MEKKTQEKPAANTREVIAYRKKCKASGTGLSHYILIENKVK